MDKMQLIAINKINRLAPQIYIYCIYTIGDNEGGCCPLVSKITNKHPPCYPAITLHPLVADSVLQITGGRYQLRHTVESSRESSFDFLIYLWWKLQQVAQSRSRWKSETRKGIEHPVDFQNKTPFAGSRLYKNKKWPDQQNWYLCSKVKCLSALDF